MKVWSVVMQAVQTVLRVTQGARCFRFEVAVMPSSFRFLFCFAPKGKDDRLGVSPREIKSTEQTKT